MMLPPTPRLRMAMPSTMPSVVATRAPAIPSVAAMHIAASLCVFILLILVIPLEYTTTIERSGGASVTRNDYSGDYFKRPTIGDAEDQGLRRRWIGEGKVRQGRAGARTPWRRRGWAPRPWRGPGRRGP